MPLVHCRGCTEAMNNRITLAELHIVRADPENRQLFSLSNVDVQIEIAQRPSPSHAEI